MLTCRALAQSCPDLQKYNSAEGDFCSATPMKEGECAEDLYPIEPLSITCLFACPLDQRCTSLPYDRSRQACGCECQVRSRNASGVCLRCVFTLDLLSSLPPAMSQRQILHDDQQIRRGDTHRRERMPA